MHPESIFCPQLLSFHKLPSSKTDNATPTSKQKNTILCVFICFSVCVCVWDWLIQLNSTLSWWRDFFFQTCAFLSVRFTHWMHFAHLFRTSPHVPHTLCKCGWNLFCTNRTTWTQFTLPFFLREFLLACMISLLAYFVQHFVFMFSIILFTIYYLFLRNQIELFFCFVFFFSSG